MLSVQ